METGHCIVLSTCPDSDTAGMLARRLVAERLAACVNIVPGIESVYRWQGEVEQARELLLVIKTRDDLWTALESRLRALHPYELPEIVRVPIAAGLAPYLDWIDNNTGTTT